MQAKKASIWGPQSSSNCANPTSQLVRHCWPSGSAPSNAQLLEQIASHVLLEGPPLLPPEPELPPVPADPPEPAEPPDPAPPPF